MQKPASAHKRRAPRAASTRCPNVTRSVDPRARPFCPRPGGRPARTSPPRASPPTAQVAAPAAAPSAAGATAPGPASLRWEGPQRVSAGTTFDVALKLTSAEAVRAAPLQLQYDAKVLEPVAVRAGGFFSDGL